MPSPDGFTAARQSNKIEFSTERGDSKVRRAYTGAIKDFDASFTLTSPQADILDEFHDTTLVDGVEPFTWTDPRTLESGTFRFLEPPQFSPLGGNPDSSNGIAWKAACKIRRVL